MTIKNKLCSLKSPIDKQVEIYKEKINSLEKLLLQVESQVEERNDEYIIYDKKLLTKYKQILDNTRSSFTEEILAKKDGHLMKKLIRVVPIIETLHKLTSYINEHEKETNVLDTLQIAPEERTLFHTCLSLFWSSNKRHDYYKKRNSYYNNFVNEMSKALKFSISDKIKNDKTFEIYQTESTLLKADSDRLFWQKISIGYHKFLEIIKLAKVRDLVDYEFDNPEGKIFASISLKSGIITIDDFQNVKYPEKSIVTAKQLLDHLIINEIINRKGEILIDPFDENDISAKLLPVLEPLEFNTSKINEIFQNAFKVSITIEQQENFAMAFSAIGRQLTQEHPQHSFSFFRNRFEKLKTIPSQIIFKTNETTEPLLRNLMPTINETDANKIMVNFGKISTRSFMNINRQHYVSKSSMNPNRRKYSLEIERKKLIDGELSSRIFQKLQDEDFLDENGLVKEPEKLFKFMSTEKKKLLNVIQDIKIIDSETTLSRTQRRQVLSILKKSIDSKFSPEATIHTAKIVANEHGLNDFTVFIIEDVEKKWILFPYDHYGNPSYNLIKVPKEKDFQKELKELPSKIGLPKGLYFTFFDNQHQTVHKKTNFHDLSLLYRKMTSNQYFLRTLAILTFSAFLFPHNPVFNIISQDEGLGVGFTLYLWLKATRGVAAAGILRKHLINCERKLSTLRYSLSLTTASLYMLLYALPRNSLMAVGDNYYNIVIPLILLDMFLSLVRWPINHEKIQNSLETYPKHMLAFYGAIMSTFLASIWIPDFLITNDILLTVIVLMDIVRIGTYLRRDIQKADRSLEERYPHKLETPTALASIATNVGITATILYLLDKTLDYLHNSYFLLP
jgi:hypothetical protein